VTVVTVGEFLRDQIFGGIQVGDRPRPGPSSLLTARQCLSAIDALRYYVGSIDRGSMRSDVADRRMATMG